MTNDSQPQSNKDSTVIPAADANPDSQTGSVNWNWSVLTVVPIIVILLAVCVVIGTVPIPSWETFIPPLLMIAGILTVYAAVALVSSSDGNVLRLVCLLAIIAVVVMWMRGQIA
ncbi:hypothetical protein J3P85_18470 [Pseudomonas sp. Z1-12]|uniref:hypothetical protein n=1 Tax=Pseudomonas sp. Z1-12 TaxID=2817408 RepID=UPI003DA9E0AD